MLEGRVGVVRSMPIGVRSVYKAVCVYTNGICGGFI
jgi:hypothetical protein